jgi:hypothetical protein
VKSLKFLFLPHGAAGKASASDRCWAGTWQTCSWLTACP